MEARVGDGRTVVLHVDLDCFYAAVEHVRLGIPTEKPLAVQQWEGLIAVNYAARAAGVVRHDRVREALKKCPELQLVHVETLGSGDEGAVGAPSRESSKVSLERYRQASLQVFSIFRRFTSVCERASIDEAYMDVTHEVDEMLKHDVDFNDELHRLTEVAEGSKPTMIVENGPCNLQDSFEKRLLAGALIANRIRNAVKQELGYTCSVGIAPNKLLAKIASARNKPDRQTLVPPRAVDDLMENLPLKKIKLLGGKLGEELRSRWSCTTAGEAHSIPLQSLISCFGERMGAYAWRAVRGAQNDKVQVKQLPKSMLAAKSFTPTSDITELRRWLGVLAEELAVRLLRDLRLNNRHPRILQLYYRSFSDHSKSCSMPHAVLQLMSSIKYPPPGAQTSEELINLDDETRGGGEEEDGREEEDEHKTSSWPPQETLKPFAGILQEAAFHLFQQVDHKFSFSRLAIAASGFQKLHAEGTQSLQKFFSSVKNPNAGASLKSPEAPSPELKLRGIKKFLKTDNGNVSQYKVQDTGNYDLTQPGMEKYVEHPDESSNRDEALFGAEPEESDLEKARDQGESTGRVPVSDSGELSAENHASFLDSEGRPREEVNFNSIDVAEQRRILRSFESSRRSSAASKSSSKTKKRSQAESGIRSISDFFKKPINH